MVTLAALIFAGGVVALCLSFMLSVDFVTDPQTRRETGYVLGTNWSMNYMLFIPVATLGVASLLGSISTLLRRLRTNGMLIDVRKGSAILEARIVDTSWRSLLRAVAPFTVFLIVGSFIMSGYECWRECYRPLFEFGSVEALADWSRQNSDDIRQVNWATAALANPPERISPGMNFSFGVIVWSIQGLAMVSIVTFHYLAVTLAIWVARHGLFPARMRIVPDLTDSDARCGYQRFEQCAFLLFAVAGVLVAMFWLVVVRSYTRLDGAAGVGMSRFVFSYGEEPLRGLFDTGWTGVYDVFWVRFGGIVAVLMGAVLCGCALIPIAMRLGRNYALDRIQSASAAEFEAEFRVPPTVARERLFAMPVWPYRFLSAPLLVLTLALALCSLWFFRLGPYAFLAILVIALLQARVLLRSRDRSEGRGVVLRYYAVGASCLVLILGGALVANAVHTNTGGRGRPDREPQHSATYTGSYERSHALLIGINYGTNSDHAELFNAEEDVTAVAARLEGMNQGWEVTRVPGAEATGDRITTELGDLCREAGPNDRIFVMFAGHGQKGGARTGWAIAVDGEPMDGQGGPKLNWIPFSTFTSTLFDVAKAKHVLVALDCCYSGRGVLRGQELPEVPTAAQLASRRGKRGKAHVIITSGRPNEQVGDGKKGTHSPFATAFLEALGNDPDFVTASSLISDVKGALLGNRSIQQSANIRYVEQDGEFVFRDPPK